MRPARDTVLSALTALLVKNVGSRLGNRFDTEDAIMEAVLRVLEWEDSAPETLSLEDAAARSYASRAVQNILIDRFRAQTRDAVVSSDLSKLPAAGAGEEEPQANALLDVSARLLDELAEAQQDLLRAYFAGPELFREESIRQQLTPNAARVRIHRLLQQLRKRAGGLVLGERL